MTDSNLTLRQFYDKFYDKTDLEETSAKKLHFELLRWERLTSNPPISIIDNDMVAAFRQAMVDHEYAPQTINSTWGDLRAVLRVACPEDRHNPRGRGAIEKCPYMKPVKEVRAKPRRVSLHELGDVYLACEHARSPSRNGFPPREWWRALIVLAYFTGLRKGDLLTLDQSQIDLREGRLTFRARKTRKEDTFPLHPVAVDHLERIWNPRRQRLFDGMLANGGRLYTVWKRIVAKSGVSNHFALHDIRRTAASEIERVKPGMAAVFLQHAANDVTGLFYLNQEEELLEAIEGMRFPEPFTTGTAIPIVEQIRPRRAPLPKLIEPDEWQFRPGGFAFRGDWFELPGQFPRLLELLVQAGGPLTWCELYDAGIGRRISADKAPARIRQSVCLLRRHLRDCLGLPDDVDPVRCVHRGNGGAYMLTVPRLERAAT